VKASHVSLAIRQKYYI